MKTLSIRQPWACLIVNGFKDIENRSWNTKHRGMILIHAGKRLDHDGLKWVNDNFPEIKLPTFAQGLGMGGIVGIAEISRVLTKSSSPWFFGPYGIELLNAKPLAFISYKGKLGFFDFELPEGIE